MLSKITADFDKYKKGYKWKSEVDEICEKNMAAFSAAVDNSTYLPHYSSREPEGAYKDRLSRAKNAYMNFPERIVMIYQNSIFRSGEPNRTGTSKEFKRFIENVDGAGTSIGEFVKSQVFVLNEVHGGSFIVIDKPEAPDTDTLTRQVQEDTNFYPYAYLYTWQDLTNFGVDRHRQLDWILFKETKADGHAQYRYFDKTQWAVLDEDGVIISKGEHNLRVVPVISSFSRRNAAHRFLTPKSPIDDIVRLSLKIFEYQSQLEQMIVNHAFMKLAVPEGMWKVMQKEGLGNINVLVFPDDMEVRAHYVESTLSEIDKMVDLVYNVLPNKVLYFGTVRDKVAMPREESGDAKFIDSADEVANLLEKASQMERVENEMVRLAQLWEGEKADDNNIVYNKVFDIKSTNEQISEIVQIFKEDLGSPEFNRQIVKRLMFNMLGHVPDKTRKEIETDLDYSFDPSLNLEDLNSLAQNGLLEVRKLARKYNPELRNAKDEEVDKFIEGNLQRFRGVNSAATDLILDETGGSRNGQSN